MKKFITIAAIVLLAASMAAPSYGQTSAHEHPGIIAGAPPLQLEIMPVPAAADCFRFQPAGTVGHDALNSEAPVQLAELSVERMPMLRPEDTPKPLPLYGVRLWRPPVESGAAKLHYLTDATGKAAPHYIRNAILCPGDRQLPDNPATNY